MKRELDKLSSGSFDVLIVGAGIYGATAAWDAATRGLSVALIDKGDFGAATSANSLKIVHGGLRYLQQLDLKRMRESIRERRTFLQMAPHLVHPLPCVMPTYGHMMKGPEIMRIGLLLNDVISADRNRISDSQKHLPMGRVISRDACLRLIPGIKPDRINGGAFWTDAQMFNSDRLVLAGIKSAVSAGAQAANYIRADGYIRHNNQILGVQATDLESGEPLEIRSRIVVNMAGGWTDTLLGTLGRPSSRVRLSTAMNLVIGRDLLGECAAGIRGRFQYPRPDGHIHTGFRVLFAVPWRGHTMIGTYHRPYAGKPDELAVTDGEIDAFLDEINSAYTGDPVKRSDVTLAQRGFLPMEGIHPKTGDVILTKHYRIHDHAREDGLDGLVSVVGVKYTTARDVSEKVVDRVAQMLGRKKSANRTRYLRVAGGDIDRFNDFLSEALHASPDLPESVIGRLVKNYGSEYRIVLEHGDRDFLGGSSEVLRAEIVHAVKEEAALHLTDAVLRRTDIGSAGHPGKEAAESAAGIMAGLLGWNETKKQTEMENLDTHYRRLGVQGP
ncbi:glycerol-3-phosphate dehydrogenase/oxidase [bacterium]|nr:glycerol-3-phosphate dehydrogenase/oxidase [bacterium]